MGAATAGHIAALAHMQGIARQLRDAVNLPRAVKSEVSFLGETNLANSSAVRNLMTMARNSYVFCGARSGLERVLPGVKAHVLGPPTVAQTDTVKKQRSSDPDQFWQLQARAIGADEVVAGAAPILFPRHVQSRHARFPIRARWLRYHARMTRGEQLLQIGAWGARNSFLRYARTQRRALIDWRSGFGADLISDAEQLAVASDSIDAVLLPHTLERAESPHALLREVDRILRPDGHLLVLSFAPGGLWGLRHLLAARGFPNGRERMIREGRLRTIRTRCGSQRVLLTSIEELRRELDERRIPRNGRASPPLAIEPE